MLSFHIRLVLLPRLGAKHKNKHKMDTQKTINEIILLLDTLWDAHPTSNQAEVDAKNALRQRIEALEDNNKDQDISLKGWIELGDIYLADKKEWLAKKSQLEKEAKEEKAAKEAKEAELKQAKEAIGEKLTPELVEKLGKLDQEEFKTLLTDLKKQKSAEIKLITEALVPVF